MPDARRIRLLSLALIAIGAALVLLTSLANRPATWRPIMHADGSVSGQANGLLQAGADYELALELPYSAPDEQIRRLTQRRTDDTSYGTWSIACDDVFVATGDSRDYIRTLSKRSTLGQLRRVMARSSLEQDEASYSSFGLSGSFLVMRVVGAFSAPAASDCQLSWTAANAPPGLRVVVRASEQSWQRHTAQFGFIAVLGELMLFAGLPLLLVSAMRRRSADRQE